MNDVNKNLGHATAYGYAKSKGYTGTEEEFAELMASYADVGQTAVDAALRAKASEEAAKASETASKASELAASTSASSASASETNASQSASVASTKASEAASSASEASSAASTATTKASEASQSASSASGSATAAQTAKTGAEAAQEAAETAQEAAETAETHAKASETAAASSATSASDSATTATTKASEAAQSATDAGTSATNAANSATAASGSASTASTKASQASQSATDAANSATAAGTAKTDAETAKTAAQTAQTAAETAQGKAEDAQAAAEAAAQTLVIDTTLTQPNQAAEAKATGDAISLLKSHLGASTDNLVTLNASVTYLGVVFADNGAEGMSITGTATDNGGRARQITKQLTLAPGTYYACIFADPSESAIPAFILQTVVGFTILKYFTYPNSVYAFTLTEETAVFVGANLSQGTVYRATGVIIYISSVYPHATTADSALDFIARNAAEKTKYLTESSFYDLKEIFPFTIGSYNSSNDTINYGTRNRLLSFDKYTTHEQLKVSMPTGYRFGIVFYDGDSRTDTGWVIGEYLIPAGSTFLLQLARTTDVGSEIITDVKTCDLYRNLTFVAWTEEPEATPYDSILPISTEQLSVANPWSQGACLVGRKLVGFNASSDDHSTNGTARIYDVDNNLTQIGSFAHNTGHASTADYCKRTDTMSVANGTYASGVVPTIYLVKNASAKIAAASNILITDPDVIAFDVSNLTGQGVGACFGETDQFMYVLTVENASQYDQYPTKYIYKLLMGKGSNDMTSLFASDNFGTFISGCGDNEYNGTAHLVASYSLEVYGELQGLKYRNGFLYMSCDSSKLTNVKTPYLAKMKLTADAAELVDFYHIPNYSDTGNLLTAESEGFVFDGAVGYVTVFPSGNSSRTLRFNAIV